MNKDKLTISDLRREAVIFCNREEKINHTDLYGVTDGKAVGTYVEHRFQEYLKSNYVLEIGSSARGIDLPGAINTDIKVTRIKQPQSSCPFRDAKQKIFGLGYNLLVFTYNKTDNPNRIETKLEFIHCTFIEKDRTADYQTTYMIREILKNNGNKDDIISYFLNINLPGDEITYNQIADEIFKNPPVQGYLTISNALQWRLQYRRAIELDNKIEGVYNLI